MPSSSSRPTLWIRWMKTRRSLDFQEFRRDQHGPSFRNTKPMPESYYLLTELLGTPASPLRDIRDIADAPWIKAIRGTANFEAVRRILVDKSSALVLQPSRVNASGIDAIDNSVDSF